MAVPTVTTYLVPSGGSLHAGRFGGSVSEAPTPSLPAVLVLSVPSSATTGAAAVMTMTNSGGTAAAWALSSSPSAAISPASGTLAPGASVSVSITPPAAGSYSISLTSAGSTITGSPATMTATDGLPPSVILGAYRTANSVLFSDLATPSSAAPNPENSDYIETPPRSGIAAPASGFMWGLYGPTHAYAEAAAKWAWVNPGGDWINTAGTPQATTNPHFSFAANAAASGASTYTVGVTTAMQAVQSAGKFAAFILRTSASRAIASQHSGTKPSVAVTYSDGTTGTLHCRACVWLKPGTAYSQIGRTEHPINPSVLIEFDKPTKPVVSATLTITVTQHTATAATISAYLANPPLTVRTTVTGVAAGYPADAGLAGGAGVLVSHRYQDGSTLADWVLPSTVPVWDAAAWDAEVLGTGGADTTKLPTAHSGTAVAGKWLRRIDTANVSLVSSSYTGDGFVPLAPGLGALRIVTPSSTGADGSVQPIGTEALNLGCDLWLLFPKSVCGTEAVKRTFTRFYARIGTPTKALADTKMFRESGGPATYAARRGKWGVGVQHCTPLGGNGTAGGGGAGWSNRMGYIYTPSEAPVGGIVPFVHSLDNIGTDMMLHSSDGAAIYPGQWECFEVECDLNTWNAAGGSPSDGVMRVWRNGVLVATHTGWQYRDGPKSVNSATGASSLGPFGTMAPMGLWLNHYQGGRLPADADTVMFIAAVACGTSYIGPMASALPAWRPAAGASASIGYTTGAHPSGLLATLKDASPEFQSWNPLTPDGYPGPWAGVSPQTRRTWATTGVYCGAAWSEHERKWILIGTGHDAPNVPVPVAYDVGTLAWEWLAVPPPTNGLSGVPKDNLGKTAASAAYPLAQFDPEWAEWQGDYSGWPAGFSRPGKVFPESGHSYHATVWIPGSAHGNIKGAILNVVEPTGIHNGAGAGAERMRSGHVFDLDTRSWVRTANKPSSTSAAAGGSVYHPGVGKAFAMQAVSSQMGNWQTLDVYTPSTKTWAQTTATAGIYLMQESGGLAAWFSNAVPTGLLLYFCPETTGGSPHYTGTRHRIYAVDAASAAAGSHTWQVLTVSASSWPTRGSDNTIATIGWCYCPRNGCYYATDGRDGSTTLWKLSPPAGVTSVAAALAGTWTVTTETFAPGIVSKNLGGAAHTANIYNRLKWDDTAQTLLFMPEFGEARMQAITPAGF